MFIGDTGNNVVREVVKATGDIVTFAGNGIDGYSGDGGQATSAELYSPRGLAFDTQGNLYIADAVNGVIREVVKATGDIITFAGNGGLGDTGDGGSPTAAQIGQPYDVIVAPAGDVYICDGNNNFIREVVKSTGLITTVAGNGTAGYSGDGGPATNAQLKYPQGIAMDSAGDLFISDTGNDVIREVVKATGDIITVAGTPGPGGFGGNGGPATSAVLHNNVGLAVDPLGDLYIADASNNEIREVTVPVQLQVMPVVSPTTTTLTASANPTFLGQSVTFTAVVSALPAGLPSPTGFVQFFDNGTPLNTTPLAVDSTGTAVFTTSALPLGNQTITAGYSGDVNNTPSGSAPLTVNVIANQASTTTSLTSSANPTFLGQPVTFTATV